MLEIALAPAPVALEIIGNGRRRLLERTAQTLGHPYLPAGAAQEGRLDEIMAHDLADPKGGLPGRRGKPQCCMKARVRMIALWPQ